MDENGSYVASFPGSARQSGKPADLMVLDRNPLEDVRHTKTIRYVMKDGWLFDGATLNMLWPEKKALPKQY